MTGSRDTVCGWWGPGSFALLVLCLWVSGARAQGQAPADQSGAKPTVAPAADPKATPRPHRVITNDDFPSRTPAGSSPEIERRLQQVNFCDHACFQTAFKESSTALHQNWPYAFTMQENQLIEDALLQRLEQLRADGEWQNRLRNMIAARIAYCQLSARSEALRTQQRAEGKSVTAADLAEEEAASKENVNHGPNLNTASSALLDYRARFQKDPLKSALMLHQYFEQVKETCAAYPQVDP